MWSSGGPEGPHSRDLSSGEELTQGLNTSSLVKRAQQRLFLFFRKVKQAGLSQEHTVFHGGSDSSEGGGGPGPGLCVADHLQRKTRTISADVTHPGPIS